MMIQSVQEYSQNGSSSRRSSDMKKYDSQSIPFRNMEGYADPTVWLALRNVEMQRLLEEKLRKRIAENESAKRKTAKWQQMAVSLAEREELREDERFVWEELANAIIIQAAEDWRSAMRHLSRHPRSMAARIRIRETEEFFLSEFYMLLTTYDGHTLLKRLKEEFRS